MRANSSRTKENGIRLGKVKSRRIAVRFCSYPYKTTSRMLALYELSELSEYHIEAIESSRIVKDHHHTIEPYFGKTVNKWKIGLANGLFLPTRPCVSAMLLEGHFKMSLSRPHGRTQGRVLGRVAKSVSTTG
ncbi:Linoleate 9S-lipoxygenase 1 -like protein [Gossypium arboreum]|uniref:Linoleate 9S-lipoxygenase 1-like protein n=1 Tax=Gossypium arboreum TaxID=29729 RepID=A0A0B0NQ54_GOSAR|nr:Linoleate 9S-lipoxygenase 1 -like protein [Gossypium arboreum]